MATQTAKYFYCSGFTKDFVTVTMTIPSCPTTGTFYDDTYCNYRTYKKTISFQLSKAIPLPLVIRYRINWIQETDYDEYTKQRGSLIYTYTMPAGQTYVSLTYGDGYTPPFCKEERWCTSGSGDGIITPAVAY